jgi:hypothetical protein
MKVNKEVLKSLAICLTAKTMTEDEFVEKVSTLLKEEQTEAQTEDTVNATDHLVEDLYHDILETMNIPKIFKYMSDTGWYWIGKPVTESMIKEEIRRQVKICVDGLIRSAAEYAEASGDWEEGWKDQLSSYSTSCGGFTTKLYLDEDGNIEGECLFAIESTMMYNNNYNFSRLVKSHLACKES